MLYNYCGRSCEVGQASMVQFLLSHRADIRVLPVDGMTPLHIACSRGHAECVKLLLNVSIIKLYLCLDGGRC